MKTAVKIVAATCFALANYSATAAQDMTANCRIGIYHLRDGSDVDIGQGKDSHLRWRRKDGTSGELTEATDGTWTSTFGWTSRLDGKRVSFSDCGKGAITFAGLKGQRIALAVTDTRFRGDDVSLAGAEDRSAIVLNMTLRGYCADIVAKAMEVADASEAVLVSNFNDGYDRIDALRAKYASEPWFKYVHGNFTFAVLEWPQDELREKGPKLLRGIQFHYDPMPVLRNLRTPQLWILGEDDIDAPSAETARRLKAIAAEGHPIVTAVFPHAEHGIFEYETQPDGTRVSTGNSDGYFSMMRDYIRSGRLLQAHYGSSVISDSGRK